MTTSIYQRRRVLVVLLFFLCFSVFGIWYFSSSSHQHLTISLDAVRTKSNLVPFLVLGSGPASLSAALYGARTRIRTVVLRGNKPGGQLTGTSYIENWPGIKKIRGTEIVKQHQDQAERFGALMIDDVASSVDFSQWPYKVETEEGKTIYAMSIMIGTGATARGLKVPGEQEYWGKGVTTCAICDAPYHKGDDVVVVGGGDSAMEEALELSSYAKKVTLLVRGDQLRASPSMVERVNRCVNVGIAFNRSIIEVKGDGNHVTSIIIKNNKTKELEEWNVRGVFLGIGHDPNTNIFKGALKLSSEGYIEIDSRTQQTSLPGVVAAGDVCDPRYRQAGVAAGDGIKAGLDIVWWLISIGYNNQVQEELEPNFFDATTEQRTKIVQLNSEDEFKAAVKKIPEEIVVLDFFTDSCPSCMHMMPVVEWAATKFSGKIRFFKVDASRAFDLAKKFKVPDVPHIIVMRRSEIVARYHDAMSRIEIYAKLKKFVEVNE